MVKGQGHSDVISIFLHDSLLISLLWISSLLCPIIMKFGLSLRYVFGRFVFESHKNQMDDDIIVTTSSFLHTIVHISIAIELTNFILGNNIQQHKVHLMIEVKVT